MTLTREDMLRELELLPAWRLNAPLPEVEVIQAVAPQEASNLMQALPADTVQESPNPIAEEADIQVPQIENSPDMTEMDLATLNKFVMSSGDAKADWFFIADAPNAEDLEAGHPFGGQAGELLDKMLIAIQLQRHRDVFLTYLSEAKYFSRQIEIIRPKLIFSFGESTAQMLTQSAASLDELRGKVHDCHGVALVVSYSPVHLMTHPQDKAKAWADLCLARETIKGFMSA
jgi:DNA polymerase